MPNNIAMSLQLELHYSVNQLPTLLNKLLNNQHYSVIFISLVKSEPFI